MINWRSLLLPLLLVVMLFCNDRLLPAEENDVFTQNDWSGGVSVQLPAHPANKTQWTFFSSKDTSLNNASPGILTISKKEMSYVHTSDTQFNLGTFSGALVRGTADAAYLTLEPDAPDAFQLAPGQWSSLPEMPSLSSSSPWLRAGAFIYAVWSNNKLGRYDIAQETWAFMADMPADIGGGSSMAYPSNGGDFIYVVRGGNTRNFYKYSISGNTWTSLLDTPYFIGGGGAIVATDTKVFCVAGGNSTRAFEYTIATNTWVAKSFAPSAGMGGATLSYPGTGSNIYAIFGGYYLYRYSLAGNAWVQLPTSPVYISTLQYPGTGNYLYGYLPDNQWGYFARYDFTSSKWENLMDGTANASIPIYPFQGIFYYPGTGDRICFLSGNNYLKPLHFDPVAARWDEPMGPRANSWFLYYPQMLSDGNNFIYATSGYNTSEFSRYSVSANNWIGRKPLPWSVEYYGHDLVYHKGLVYAQRGNGNSEFASYDPLTDLWTARPNVLGSINQGGALVSDGSYIYGFRGGGTASFWRYDAENAVWDDVGVADLPAPDSVYYGGDMVYPYAPGAGDYIFASTGYSNASYNRALWRYQISTNTWTRMADAPFIFYDKAQLVWPGDGNYIYAIFGMGYSFARYNITSDTWTVMPSAVHWSDVHTAMVGHGGKVYTARAYEKDTAVFDTASGAWNLRYRDRSSPAYGSIIQIGDTVYAFYGDNSTGIWKYSLSQKKWTDLITAPFMLGWGTKAAYPGTGNYIYVLEGRGETRFWRYDFSNNTWQTMPDTPVPITIESQFEAGGDNLFAAAGYGLHISNADHNKFMKYSISANRWEMLANLPLPMNNYHNQGNTFAYNPELDVLYWRWGNGSTHFLEYNVGADAWRWLAYAPAGHHNGGALLYPGAGDKVYWLSYQNNFCEYSISTNRWQNLSVPPRLFGYTGSDGDMFYPGGDYIYFFDSAFGLFSRYSLSTDQWDQPVGLPHPWPTYDYHGVASSGPEEGAIYLGGYQLFYNYNTVSRRFTSLNSPYGDLGWSWDEWGSALVYAGAGDYLYTTQGRYRNSFARYSVQQNKWIALNAPPFSFGSGHALAVSPSKVYCLRGDGTDAFWMYDLAAGTWSAKAALPGAASFGAALVYPGWGDYIYATRGNNTASFYRYSISGNTWTALADLPVALSAAHVNSPSMMYPGKGDYLYFVQGGSWNYDWGTTTFLRYSISANSWQELASAPAVFRSGANLVCPKGSNLLYATRGGAGHAYDILTYRMYQEGSYVSPALNIGNNSAYGALSWTAGNSDGTLEVKVRSSADPSMASAADWRAVAPSPKGGDMSRTFPHVQPGHQYLQYQVSLMTEDPDAPPKLNDITFNFFRYPLRQELVSSAYNSGQAQNRLTGISWTHTVLPGSAVRFQLRTAPDNNGQPGTWSQWLGPSGVQTLTDTFAEAESYSYDPMIEVSQGVTRLLKYFEDYAYTQRIVIDNGTGQSYANVLMVFNLTSANSHFWAHVKSDGSDVRFVDGAGNTLSYNLSANGSAFNYAAKTARIFVRVLSLPANQKTSIFMKYGNASAVAASDPNVFSFLRFGSGGTIDATLFDVSAGPYLIDNDRVVKLQGPNWGWGYQYVTLKTNYYRSNEPAFYFRWKQDGSGSNHAMIGWKVNNAIYSYDQFPYCFYFDNGFLRIYEMGAHVQDISSYSRDTWYDCKLVLKPGSGATYYWRPTGQADWTMIRDTTSRSEDILKPSVDHYSPDRIAYTGDWMVGGADAFYQTVQGSTDSDLPYYFSTVEDSQNTSSLSGWNYRSAVTIDNTSGGELTNYQVKVDLTSSYDGFWSRCREDGADVRFVDSDNTTILTYHQLSFDYTDKTASYWVKLPRIGAGEVRTIYLYYGRSDASAVSSFNQTMVKDFNDRGTRNKSALDISVLGAKASAISAPAPAEQITLEADMHYRVDYWPAGWSYRKRVTIDNTAGPDGSYALVQFDVPHQPEMNADYSDLRFWDQDMSNKLNYEIKASDAAKATVTIEVPALLANQLNYIYVYYGNDTAVSESTPLGYVPTSGLRGFWRFDEGEGLTAADSSGYNLTGTLLNSPTWGSRGFGSAIQTNNANNGINIPDSNFSGYGDFTMGAWIYIGGPHRNYTGTIMSSGDWNTEHWAFGISQSNKDIQMRKPYASYYYNFVLNRWYHVAAVRSGNTIGFYVNGNKIGSTSANTAPLASNATNTTIGRETYAGGYFSFNGAIDSPAVYDRALSDDEVMALSRAEETIPFSAVLSATGTQPANSDFLPGFKYRRQILFDNTGNDAATDKVYSFNVDFLDGKMRPDYGDIRFLDTDGKTLSYRIDSADAGRANFLVQVPVVLRNSVKNIFMYYGNSQLVSAEDATVHSTRVFSYPDFSGWTDNWGTPPQVWVGGGHSMMGGFGKYGAGASTTFTLPGLGAGTYNISFDYYTIDSWDAEYGKLYANEAVAWEASRAELQRNYVGNLGTTYGYAYVWSGTVPVVHRGGDLTLRFTSSLDEGSTNESFGLNNIVLLGSTLVSPTFFPEESAPVGVDQALVVKAGSYGLKFTDAGLTAFVNSTSVSTGNYISGDWMHAAMTYDGAALKLYVDGVLEASSSASGSVNDSGSALLFGENMKGWIDEVRVWNLVRSSGDLKENRFKSLVGSEAGLLGYWRFDENTGTFSLDASGHGHDVVLSGGAGWQAPSFLYLNGAAAAVWHLDEGVGFTSADATGNGNQLTLVDPYTSWSNVDLTGFSGAKSLRLNGDTSFARASSRASLNITGRISIEAWINPANTDGTKVILSKGNDAGTRWNYRLSQVNDTIQFAFYNGRLYTFATPACLQPEETYYVAVTLDETARVLSIYVNGTLCLSVTVPALPLLVNDDDLYLGREASGANKYVGGLDEVRLYDRVLSAGEIQAHYEHRLSVLSAPAVYDVYSPPPDPGIGAYAVNNPVIQPNFGVFYRDKSILQLQEVAIRPVGTDIRYQVSADGYSWYWWNSSAWEAVSGGYLQTNTAGEINEHLPAFLDLFPEGDFYYRAYLHSEPYSFRTPSLDSMSISLKNAETYYFDPSGQESINTLHTDADSDQWYQYRAIFSSDGKQPAVLDDVSLEYINAVLNLTAPVGGETLVVGQIVPVTWNAQALQVEGGSGQVSLRYSPDNGNTWELVAEHVSSNGSYQWTVPDSPARQGYLRISSEDLPTVSDITDASFRVLALSVTAPNGGEVLEVGRKFNITWNVTGTIPNEVVKIEYSPNNGTTWKAVTAITPNNGVFEWTVPADASDTVLVRVTSPSNSRIQDTSDQVFSVVPAPAFTISSPAAGASWSVGAVKPLSWRTNSLIFSPQVRLEYSADNFVSDIHEIAVVSVGQPQGAGNNDDIVGTYDWTVPDAVHAGMRVRVTEVGVPAGRGTQQEVALVSPAFSVVDPVLAVTAPQVDVVWVAGDTNNITWTVEGHVSDALRLEYSLDGQNYVLIAGDLPNTGSYAWVVPLEAASGSVRVRLTDAERPQVSAESALFRVLLHTTIELIQPVGGEHITMGTSYEVKWRTFGHKLNPGGADYNKLSIFYSVDDGATWTMAGFNRPNTGTYAWTVPDFPSQQARIKVVDQNDALVAGISPANFVIELPTITLTSPLGGERWYATGSYSITWTSVGSLSNNLKIEYSVDGGSTWKSLRTGQANTGTYLWSSVADEITSAARIRITDVQYPSVTSSSPASFSIVSPSFTLAVPNGGEVWAVGTNQNIRWDSSGKDAGAIRDDLLLQYSSDEGQTWNVIASHLSNSGTYNWIVPDTLSESCLVRISDSTRPATTDTSDAVFEISLPRVSVLSPNGGELWPVGVQYPVTWESVGAVSNDIRIEYSLDNFVTAHVVEASQPNTGEYLWTVPDDISDTVRVRLTDNQRPGITDSSDLTFAITLPRLTLTYPNGGEIVSVSDVENITWEALGSVSDNLKIEYSKDNFVSDVVVVAQNVPNTGTYAWTVPDDRSAALRVRIIDADRPAVWDKSDANFTILPTPQITFLAPEAGAVWRVGSVRDITWEDNGGKISNNLRLSYSVDNGTTWKQIATGLHNNGKYAWTIPDDVFPSAQVRIMDESRPLTVATSPAFNLALPAITITSPNGSEVWSVGDHGPVKWETEGSVSENLLLSYSPDNGTTWTLVRGGIPNSGNYSWTVPDYITTQCLVKLVDGNRPAVMDVSDDVFVINPLPTITFLTPGSGDEYVLGDSVPVTWDWTGLSIANLTLDYSSDNFTTRRIIETNLANTGSYSWVVPADAITGRTIKFRLTDGVRSQITAASQGNVRIRGGFKVLSPNGGEKLVARSTHQITWQTMGTIANVRLEYTTDGVNWSFIGTAVNTGTYNWVTPDIRSSVVRVRVSDVDDNSTVDASDADFSLVYATAVFKVMDYDTYQHLTDFSASEPASGWTDSSLSSPMTRTAEYPYGTYTTFFSKQEYIDNSVTWTPLKQGVEPYVVTVYLENAASAQVTWEAILTYSFSPATDSLTAVGSLQRKGKLMGSNETERSDMGAATFKIYETDGTTVRNSMASPAPGSAGMYNFALADTMFESGRVYPATLTIEYRGREYTSAANIDVGSEIMQYQFFTKTSEQLMSAVSNIQSTVQATSDDMKEVVSKDIASIKTELQNETRKILFSTQQELPARLDLLQETVQREMSAEILNTESQIKGGETLTIRYRTDSGLRPVIDVYNAQNMQVLSAAPMIELPGTGIYQYPVLFYQAWGRGDFTIVCSEASLGTLDAMTITVMQSDVDQVYSQVSSLRGSTSGIANINTTVNKLSEQFTSIENVLNDIGSGKSSGSTAADAAQTAVAPLYGQLASMAKQIQSLVGDGGVNLGKMLDVSADRQGDMTYLKNKTQELKAAMEVSKKILENMNNKPVTQVWYEYKE